MIQNLLPEPQSDDLQHHPRGPILIVDDDEDQVFCLSQRLEGQGFEPIAAHKGRHGLALAHLEEPSLILLDLRLPDMDGLDVCAALADDPATCGIPIIILSGMERSDIVRSSRAAGCTFFVRKPYDPNALLALIECSIAGPQQDW